MTHIHIRCIDQQRSLRLKSTKIEIDIINFFLLNTIIITDINIFHQRPLLSSRFVCSLFFQISESSKQLLLASSPSLLVEP